MIVTHLPMQMKGIEDAWWPLTGDIDAATTSLAQQVQALGQDVFNATVSALNPSWPAFQDSWNAFVSDFNNWAFGSATAGPGSSIVIYAWNPSRRDALLGYRQRFNDLLAAAKSMGVGTLQTPDQAAPSNDLLGTVQKVVTYGAIAAGAYVAYTLYKDFRRG